MRRAMAILVAQVVIFQLAISHVHAGVTLKEAVLSLNDALQACSDPGNLPLVNGGAGMSLSRLRVKAIATGEAELEVNVEILRQKTMEYQSVNSCANAGNMQEYIHETRANFDLIMDHPCTTAVIDYKERMTFPLRVITATGRGDSAYGRPAIEIDCREGECVNAEVTIRKSNWPFQIKPVTERGEFTASSNPIPVCPEHLDRIQENFRRLIRISGDK